MVRILDYGEKPHKAENLILNNNNIDNFVEKSIIIYYGENHRL